MKKKLRMYHVEYGVDIKKPDESQYFIPKRMDVCAFNVHEVIEYISQHEVKQTEYLGGLHFNKINVIGSTEHFASYILEGKHD